MSTTTRTRKARTADTAPKGLPRDLDESDVIADAERMADELAAREAAAAKPAPRRSRKATETPGSAAPAPRKARAGKASQEAAPAQAQQPAQAVEGEKAAATPRLNQAEMVLAFLAQRPGEDFGPHAISKAITPEGRKRLGLRDCLARLAKDGKVQQTGDKPLRYRLA